MSELDSKEPQKGGHRIQVKACRQQPTTGPLSGSGAGLGGRDLREGEGGGMREE